MVLSFVLFILRYFRIFLDPFGRTFVLSIGSNADIGERAVSD